MVSIKQMNKIPRCNQGRETMGVIRQAILNASEHSPTGSEGTSEVCCVSCRRWEMKPCWDWSCLLFLACALQYSLPVCMIPEGLGTFIGKLGSRSLHPFSVNAPRVHIVFQKQNPRFTPLLSPTDNCHCNKSQSSRVSKDMRCSGNAGGLSLACVPAVVRHVLHSGRSRKRVEDKWLWEAQSQTGQLCHTCSPRFWGLSGKKGLKC